MTAVNDVFLVTVRMLLFGQRVMNTFHYRISAQTAPVDEAIAADGLLDELNEADQLVDALRACIPPQVTMEAIWAQKIHPVRYRAVKTPLAVDGTYAHDTTTSNVAAAVSRHDAFATRASSGRIEVPISTEGAAVSNGLITPGFRDLLEDLADQMLLQRISNSGAVTWKPCLFHRETETDVASSTDITGADPESTIRVLTRRTVGRGE